MLDQVFAEAWALCTPGVVRGGVIAGLFVAGLSGSVMHCMPMCGGLVLGQVSDRLARVPAAGLCEGRRLRAGLLLPYHAGRLVTYAGLGAVAAMSAAVLGHAPWFAGVTAVLLLLASALFLGQAVARAWPRLGVRAVAPPGWSRAILWLTRRIDRSGPSGGFLLGLALGLLPCGFLYGALMAAAATADPVQGGLAMLAFGLGTVPGLMVVGVAGHALGQAGQRMARKAAAPLLAANAVLLAGLAVRQVMGL